MSIKKTLIICAIFSLLLTACAAKSGGAADEAPLSFLDYVPSKPYLVKDYPLESVSGKTVSQYFADEKIYSGWNLGNTLDSHSSGVGYEMVWGNPEANQALMNGIKAAGFDIIHIPVTWMGNMGAAPDHRITSSRLARVAEVAEMAHNAGLKAIINIHHDGANDGSKDTGWLSISRASHNKKTYNLITYQFVRLWQQIAVYFQNHGDWLIFEGFNELHNGGWQGGADTWQWNTLNNWNQLFIDIVRLSGGNNTSRFLLINSYCADNHQALSGSFKWPTDTASDKLILSFHYYAPWEFTIQGSISSWGTNSDKQKVDSDFAPFKGRFIDKGIPVIIGECGAVLQPGNNTARQSRYDYISCIFSTAKKYSLVPVYWDNGAVSGTGEKFGLFNRNTGQPISDDSKDLITMMINAVK